MAFTAADVKKLREMTNVGMMDCKKALTETDGDMDKAVDEDRIDRKCNRIAYRDITSCCIHDHGVHTDLT